MKMPLLFVGHGSPMNIVEENQFSAGWKQIANQLPTPKAILCVSAHWFTDGQFVSTAENPETIYDFFGFPEELYQIKYPAPGAPDLAEQVANLFGNDIHRDANYGLDHGAWAVLRFLFPEANVPVFQLSINRNNSATESYAIGQKLKSLRDEDVLIVASGNVVHNLRLVNWNMDGGYTWADSFDRYIKDHILAHNADAIIHYERAGKEEMNSFHFRDHYDPLLYCLGATDTDDQVEVFNDARVLGALSMTSYLWKPKN